MEYVIYTQDRRQPALVGVNPLQKDTCGVGTPMIAPISHTANSHQEGVLLVGTLTLVWVNLIKYMYCFVHAFTFITIKCFEECWLLYVVGCWLFGSSRFFIYAERSLIMHFKDLRVVGQKGHNNLP